MISVELRLEELLDEVIELLLNELEEELKLLELLEELEEELELLLEELELEELLE
jgi:hypothetical protein